MTPPPGARRVRNPKPPPALHRNGGPGRWGASSIPRDRRLGRAFGRVASDVGSVRPTRLGPATNANVQQLQSLSISRSHCWSPPSKRPSLLSEAAAHLCDHPRTTSSASGVTTACRNPAPGAEPPVAPRRAPGPRRSWRAAFSAYRATPAFPKQAAGADRRAAASIPSVLPARPYWDIRTSCRRTTPTSPHRGISARARPVGSPRRRQNGVDQHIITRKASALHPGSGRRARPATQRSPRFAASAARSATASPAFLARGITQDNTQNRRGRAAHDAWNRTERWLPTLDGLRLGPQTRWCWRARGWPGRTRAATASENVPRGD